MTSSIEISGHKIGGGAPPFIIAEVAQAHDGSLGTAHAYIDAVAETGAHAVKFQTHIAAAESTRGEPWRVRFSPQDKTRFDYWKRMEFSLEQWDKLREHSEDRGLIFLSSPFSEAAVELLSEIGISAWKVGSGETTNLVLLDKLRETAQPILVSSGMSSWSELDIVMKRLGGHQVAIFQCTSQYPCPPESVGLNLLADLRSRYGVPVGLSDHSGFIYPSLAATSLGAELLEIHVVFDKRCFGPDTSSSVTIDELSKIVEGAQFIHSTIEHPVDKDGIATELKPMKQLFEKSLVLKSDAPKNKVLTREDLASKKPGTGIPTRDIDLVVGCRLARAVRADVPLIREDLEGYHRSLNSEQDEGSKGDLSHVA